VKNKSNFDGLAKVEEKNSYKVETWLRSCSCELVRKLQSINK
jgi:hypothetical protein